MAYFISINQVFAQICQQIFALNNIQILFWEKWTKDFTLGWSKLSYKKHVDTLDHTVLSQKIECFAFKESVIKWFQSYLSNRKFFVALENVFPVAELINWGVPQGIYLRAAPLPNIYKWFTTGIKQYWLIPLCWWHLYLSR